MIPPTHPADLLALSDASEDEIRQTIADWATSTTSVTPYGQGTVSDTRKLEIIANSAIQSLEEIENYD